jgi:hypothetical protein
MAHLKGVKKRKCETDGCDRNVAPEDEFRCCRTRCARASVDVVTWVHFVLMWVYFVVMWVHFVWSVRGLCFWICLFNKSCCAVYRVWIRLFNISLLDPMQTVMIILRAVEQHHIMYAICAIYTIYVILDG